MCTGQGVAELVCAFVWRIDTGANQRMAHDRTDAVRAMPQPTDRRTRAQEQMPVSALRPTSANTSQWPHRRRLASASDTATILAAHAQMAGIPVDIFQQQGDDLAAAQAQSGQQQQDGAITKTHGVPRSQLSMTRLACSAKIARGSGGVVLHAATAGTASINDASISPRYWA